MISLSPISSPASQFIAASQSPLPPVNQYAEQIPGGSNFLQLYQVPPQGPVSFPWLFAHRSNAIAALHALTIVKDPQGNQFVHLLITKRPPLGGRLTIETPAGLWGDQSTEESALAAANREVKEETGYDVESSELLTDAPFATSPGAVSELKLFALTHARGTPSSEFREGDENALIVGTLDVPLETFVNYEAFKSWLTKMDQGGYIVGMDVLAVRGLMPPRLGQCLNQFA